MKFGARFSSPVFVDIDQRCVSLTRIYFIGKEQILFSISVQISGCHHAFISGIKRAEKLSCLKRKGATAVLFVKIKILAKCLVCIIGSTKNSEEQCNLSIFTPISQRRGIIATALYWIIPRKRLRFSAKIRFCGTPAVFKQKNTWFKEVAPENILIAIGVNIHKCHGVGSV